MGTDLRAEELQDELNPGVTLCGKWRAGYGESRRRGDALQWAARKSSARRRPAATECSEP